PSARTSRGTAGASSMMRLRRRMVPRAARAWATLFCAASTSHAAQAVQPASSRPSNTRAVGDISIRLQLWERAGRCNGQPARAAVNMGRSVAIMLRLERAGHRHADIIGLLLAQFGQPRAQLA